MNAQQRIRPGNAGFTLVEMIFVVVILGIILAITVPAFGNFIRSTRANGATNELVANLHYARSLAVKERKTFHIEFSNSAYDIKETATDEVVRHKDLPDGVTCAATADPSFYAWGLVDAVTITISGNGNAKNLLLSSNGAVSHY